MTHIFELLPTDNISVVSWIVGIGTTAVTFLLYSRQTRHVCGSSVRPETAEPYGNFLGSLNETANADRAKTEWLNMGYWENTVEFPEACEALALKLVEAGKCVPGGCVLDVGHATGESLLLHLAHPKVPRPNSLFGITSLKFQHERAVERVLSASYQASIHVQLYLGDAVFCSPSGLLSVDAESPVQTMCHPLEPYTADRATPTHPLYTSILALDCAYHFCTRGRFLEQSIKSLAPGGSIALADMCVADSMPSLVTRVLRRVYCVLFSIPPENLVTMEEYKNTMERAGYQDVVVQDISLSVFPGFIAFLKSRGVGFWLFGWMIDVWWRGCGAKFIVACGQRGENRKVDHE